VQLDKFTVHSSFCRPGVAYSIRTKQFVLRIITLEHARSLLGCPIAMFPSKLKSGLLVFPKNHWLFRLPASMTYYLCCCSYMYFFYIFGLDPVTNGSEEIRRHMTRCANPCPLRFQK
jgi:hypothetical protein